MRQKTFKRHILLVLLIASACQSTHAGDNIFTRFKNNIIDTLNYRRLSLAASTGLGIAAYRSSSPLWRYGFGAASLLNVLRTWLQAPNRYTLEGVVEMAANNIRFPIIMIKGDSNTKGDLDATRIALFMAMDDIAENQQNNTLKNDILAFKLSINNQFNRIENLLFGNIEAIGLKERLLKETKPENKEMRLVKAWLDVLVYAILLPIRQSQDFRSQFHNLKGVVWLASYMPNREGKTLDQRFGAETLPPKSYIFYRNIDQIDLATFL